MLSRGGRGEEVLFRAGDGPVQGGRVLSRLEGGVVQGEGGVVQGLVVLSGGDGGPGWGWWSWPGGWWSWPGGGVVLAGGGV